MTWLRAQLQFQKVQPCPGRLWPSGRRAEPGSASWQPCRARSPAEDGRGRRGAVRRQSCPARLAGCGTLVAFASVGAPDVAPRPCRKSNHLPAAFACESRCPARWGASSSDSVALQRCCLLVRPGKRESKAASPKKDKRIGTSSPVFAPASFPARGESPCLEVVSLLKLKW